MDLVSITYFLYIWLVYARSIIRPTFMIFRFGVLARFIWGKKIAGGRRCGLVVFYVILHFLTLISHMVLSFKGQAGV
jgi:hypothetical protein